MDKSIGSRKTKPKNIILGLFFLCLIIFVGNTKVFAAEIREENLEVPSLSDINLGDMLLGERQLGEEDIEQLEEIEKTPATDTIQLLFLITIIALAPSLLIMLTSFTRIIIVLHFTRSALGTQQMPPNQILIGIALFLTLFIMGPTFSEVNETAIKPYAAREISQSEMVETAMEPIREFMFRQVKDKDLGLFVELSGEEYASKEDIPNRVIIPAFILGELTQGFIFGFFIYIPFIVIDMVVASILMAMGMMMLPPAMISLPFKILLFILVDGWSYIVEILAVTFN